MRQGEDVPAHVQMAIITRREMTRATYEDLMRWVKAEFQLEIRSPTTIHRILKRQANRRSSAEELAQSLEEARTAMSPERLELLTDVRSMQHEAVKAIKTRFDTLIMNKKSFVSEIKCLVSVLHDLVEVEKEIKPTKDAEDEQKPALDSKLDLTQMTEEELNELAAAEGYPGLDQVEEKVGIGGPECDPGGNREMPPERVLLDADLDENA